MTANSLAQLLGVGIGMIDALEHFYRDRIDYSSVLGFYQVNLLTSLLFTVVLSPFHDLALQVLWIDRFGKESKLRRRIQGVYIFLLCLSSKDRGLTIVEGNR